MGRSSFLPGPLGLSTSPSCMTFQGRVGSSFLSGPSTSPSRLGHLTGGEEGVNHLPTWLVEYHLPGWGGLDQVADGLTPPLPLSDQNHSHDLKHYLPSYYVRSQ